MNRPLARKVKKYIREHPRKFDMGIYYDKDECGTTMCIAGTACYLAGLAMEDLAIGCGEGTFFGEARKLLGLNEEQANKLFYTEGWPSNLRDRYYTGLSKDAVKAAIARINQVFGR